MVQGVGAGLKRACFCVLAAHHAILEFTVKLFTPPFFVAAIALTMGCGLHTQLNAQNLDCKGDFAQLGNSKGTVLQKCGEPVLKDSFCKPVDRSLVTGAAVVLDSCEKIEEWTYNPGYG